jgi:hypothetical protein
MPGLRMRMALVRPGFLRYPRLPADAAVNEYGAAKF